MPKPKPVDTGYTPAVRTPKQADKRFMAHDILRALGKTPLDDDCVRVAKRRAMEAPQVDEEPLTSPTESFYPLHLCELIYHSTENCPSIL
jgi:hypothetical protein